MTPSSNRSGATLVALHVVLAIYSVTSIMSKLASGFEPLSLGFCACYAGVLVLLAFYALAWQQIIKRLPLTTAFANKAITVVWGLVWGILIFGEQINVFKIIGCALIVVGVVVFARDEAASKQVEADGDGAQAAPDAVPCDSGGEPRD